MVTLDTKTGTLRFGKWAFTPQSIFNDFNHPEFLPLLEPWVINSEWKTYRITEDKDCIVVVSFFNGKIQKFSIYPMNISKYNRIFELKKIANNLGGEKNYFWGKVEVAEDPKGGSSSILIRYV